MSQINPSSVMRLAQSTEDGTSVEGKAHAGEYAMDSKGQFVKVIKRNDSQLENPLLDCSEEDENLTKSGALSQVKEKSIMPQSVEAKRTVNLVGNEQPYNPDHHQILSHPE